MVWHTPEPGPEYRTWSAARIDEEFQPVTTQPGLDDAEPPRNPAPRRAAVVPAARIPTTDVVSSRADGPTTGWQRRFTNLVRVSDVAVITACVAAGVGLGAGLPSQASTLSRTGSGVLAWILLVSGLALARSWDERVLGAGTSEFTRVSRAFCGSAILLGLVGLAFRIDSVRLWVFAIIPACGVLCLVTRYALRKALHRERRLRQRCTLPVLAVGSEEAVSDLIRRTRRDQHFGWHVTGACLPMGAGPNGDDTIDGVPVVGDLDAVGSVIRMNGYRVVAVAPAPGWGPGRLQQLAWNLEGTPTELVVDPGLMEIAGPRLHIAPVDGLPLLRLTQPRFSGGAWLVKSAFDRVAAVLLLAMLAPLFLAIVIAVHSDGGPAFYRQERVGANGRRFRMVKFRSMCVDADHRLVELTATSDGAGPMFKMRNDPRITRVGAVLRRLSFDELPQLFNVLTGSMSLIGPRPPLPSEVEVYGPDAQRRLLVRPGMTGLWQVSGRSDLSWEETVRLDLRYVENWSIALDASILWKTVGAVVRSRGAY